MVFGNAPYLSDERRRHAFFFVCCARYGILYGPCGSDAVIGLIGRPPKTSRARIYTHVVHAYVDTGTQARASAMTPLLFHTKSCQGPHGHVDTAHACVSVLGMLGAVAIDSTLGEIKTRNRTKTVYKQNGHVDNTHTRQRCHTERNGRQTSPGSYAAA